jgi:hypothetical protein
MSNCPVPGTGQFDMSKFRFRAQRLASADSERIITAASLQKQLS